MEPLAGPTTAIAIPMQNATQQATQPAILQPIFQATALPLTKAQPGHGATSNDPSGHPGSGEVRTSANGVDKAAANGVAKTEAHKVEQKAAHVIELLRPGSFVLLRNHPQDLPPFELIHCRGGRCWVRQQAWGGRVEWEVAHRRLTAAV
jgi:hypothetical protein